MNLAVTSCLLLTMTIAPAQRPVLEETFERKSGKLRRELEKHDLLEVVKGMGVDAGSAIRATYVPYEQGSKRIVVNYPIRPALEYTLNYDVKFEKDFDFTHGGKLHGFGPDKPVAGGKAMRPDGWSARVTFAKEGGVRTYNYHQDLKGKYGDGGKVRKKNYRFSERSVGVHFSSRPG